MKRSDDIGAVEQTFEVEFRTRQDGPWLWLATKANEADALEKAEEWLQLKPPTIDRPLWLARVRKVVRTVVAVRAGLEGR